MNKHADVKAKRPRLLSLCMIATAASVLLLAGCGDNEEELPPAQQPETMEQSAAPDVEQDATMTQEPSSVDQTADPADPAGTGSADNGEAIVPQESVQPEDEARTQDVEEEPGFGEGTDPMPGAADEENDDELTNG